MSGSTEQRNRTQRSKLRRIVENRIWVRKKGTTKHCEKIVNAGVINRVRCAWFWPFEGHW